MAGTDGSDLAAKIVGHGVAFAKEIGTNEGYQKYLINIKLADVTRDVGMKQAEALSKADIKVIANSGSITGGITSLSDLLSAKGGAAIGAMMEAFANTSATGKDFIEGKAKTDDTTTK